MRLPFVVLLGVLTAPMTAQGEEDEALCDGDAVAVLAELDADRRDRRDRRDHRNHRARLVASLDGMLAVNRDIDLQDDAVVRILRAARGQPHPDFVDVTGRRWARILLHQRLTAAMVRQRVATPEVAAKLRALGSAPRR